MIGLSFFFPVLLQAGLSGSVIDAGAPILQPLFNARVELISTSESSTVVRTDEFGRFAFPSPPPGKYRLSVTHDGFIRKTSNFTIAAGPPRDDFRFALDAAPTLVGRVRDPSNIPMPDVLVEALKVVFGPLGDRSVLSVGSALTDDRGEYHLYWLDPGDYYIRASTLQLKPGVGIPGNPPADSPGPTYSPTYYPGSREPREAALVHLRINSNLNGIDFKLQQGPLVGISGYVKIDATGIPVATIVTVVPAGDTASSQIFQGRSEGKEGFYSVAGMPPGAYVVSAQYSSNGQMFSIHRKIALKLSQPAFMLFLSPGNAVNGRIRIESGAALDLRNAHVELDSVDPDLPSPAIGTVNADGQFSIAAVKPGDYAIRLLDLPGDTYMKSARSGNSNILANPLSVYAASPEAVDVILGLDGSRLDGVVVDGADRPFAAAQVVLVPNAARRGFPDQYRVTASDDDGRFSLRGIPPGDYKLFAWQNIEPNAYMNAVYMEGYEILGLPMTVPPGSAGSISVRLIPLD